MFIKLFPITLVTFLGIDLVWLTLIAKNLYAKHIGHLMAKSPNLLAALIFYLIFSVGLIFFVIAPSLENKSWTQVLLSGALFGLVTYATYDLTNLATLKSWPLLITVIDLLWGTTLSALVSLLVYLIARKIGL